MLKYTAIALGEGSGGCDSAGHGPGSLAIGSPRVSKELYAAMHDIIFYSVARSSIKRRSLANQKQCWCILFLFIVSRISFAYDVDHCW